MLTKGSTANTLANFAQFNTSPELSFAHFIAKRILTDPDRQDRSSRPIVTIAVLGIVVGMAIMILTVAITRGFQNEIRDKVIGSGSHIQISSISQTDPNETPRIAIAQPFYPSLDTLPEVSGIHIYATRPGIIETKDAIQGVVVKGIGADNDQAYIRSHLTEGELLQFNDTTLTSDVLLSRYLADRLEVNVGERMTIYLVKGREDIRPRKYTVKGIFDTGLEQFDKQVVLIDIGHLQRFNKWGVQAEIRVEDTIRSGQVQIEGLAFGGDRVYSYEWPGNNFNGKGPHTVAISPDAERKIQLIVRDDSHTIPDTAWVVLKGHGVHASPIHSLGGGQILFDSLSITRSGSGGSYKHYAGGFEVDLVNYDNLLAADDMIYRDYLGVGLRTTSVRERYPEIFSWLELLDTNVIVMIILMVLVAIINMTSALLIIILERTNMIGVLKAMGSTSASIRRIFLIDAAYILGIGILLGDALGVALCLVQKQFGIVKLDQQSYYLSAVPIDLDLSLILLLNLGTLVVCVLALVLPTLLVTRISPAKAIRFA